MPYLRLLLPFYPPPATHKLSGDQTLQRRPHEGQREERGRDVEQRMNLADSALGKLDQDVGDEPEAYTVGDVERQRQCQYGQECGDGLFEAVPRNMPYLGHHQEPDDYQGGGSDGRDEQGLASSRRVRYGDRAAEDRDQGREREATRNRSPTTT